MMRPTLKGTKAMRHYCSRAHFGLAVRVIGSLAAGLLITMLCASVAPAEAQEKKPNILVIWGDDIGWYNISAYNLGVMGYKTPNIDRVAKEGALFTDWY